MSKWQSPIPHGKKGEFLKKACFLTKKATEEINCSIKLSVEDFKQAGIVTRDFKLVKSLLEVLFKLLLDVFL